jgi:DNA-binding response OmpR family regulator
MMSANSSALRIGIVSRCPKLRRSVARSLPISSARMVWFRDLPPCSARRAIKHLDLIVVDDTRALTGVADICAAGVTTAATQIVFVNARDEQRCAALLESGADDAIAATSPTLAARLGLALRRALRLSRPDTTALGDLKIDHTRRRVWCAGDEIRLTANEWDVLHCLLMHAPRTVGFSTIADAVWQSADVERSYPRVQVHICYLRQKLSRSTRVRIRNVRGLGYQIVSSEGVHLATAL